MLALLIFPSYACAAVRITEIMYDAPGTDAGREWFEIHNTGSAPFDPTTIFFFEADTNHKLVHARGAATVSPDGYVVVVDDVDAFLADFPSYAGALFDSSWSSFSNEGEVFELRDSDGVTLDRASYFNTYGAQGDGLTLHGGASAWQSRAPSPGSATALSAAPNSSGAAAPTPTPSQSNVTSAPSSGSANASPATPPHAPKVSAGGNRTVFAQVATEFSAELSGVASEAKPFASYRWNFGNGEEVLKRALLYRYVRPGSYAVSVSASSGGVTVSDRIVVTVIPTAISILDVGADGVELYNGAAKDVDLSNWRLRVGALTFDFPKDTTLLAGKTLFFESRITKLETNADTVVDLLYPTGDIAVSSKETIEPLEVVTQSKSEEPRVEVAPVQTVIKKEKQREIVTEIPASEDAEVVEELSKESAPATTTGAADQLAAASRGVDEEGSVFWYPVLALVALIGVASSAVFLLQSSKPSENQEVGSVREYGLSSGKMADASPDIPSTLTVVARPIASHRGDGKTNEADSYTIVE